MVKAGIMIRQSLEPDSPYVNLRHTSEGVDMQWRPSEHAEAVE